MTDIPTPLSAPDLFDPQWSLLDAPETLAQISQALEPSATGHPRLRTVLTIDGVHCAACVISIEAALASRVESVSVNAATRRASVVFNPVEQPLSRIMRDIRALGYGPRPLARVALEATAQAGRRMALWRMLVAVLCMMQVMMYATPRYMAGDGEMPADIHRLLLWAEWLLTLPVLLFATWPFLSGAWRDLSHRRIGMDVPVALGLIVMFVASSLAMNSTSPEADPVWFDSITMFAAFLLIGRWLESAAREKALAGLADQLAALPESVLRIDEQGQQVPVSPGALRPGDQVWLLAGALIPADGCVPGRDVRVDESMLTGESHPVLKRAGEPVLAGSALLDGPVILKVQRAAQDSRAREIADLIAQASAARPRLARLADRWSGPFLGAVLVMAAAAAAVWWVIEPSRAVWVAASVLIVTCPCALSLAAPAALLSGSAALARQGVLLRSPDALEALATIDLLLFDKTGTLTDARPVLRRMVLESPTAAASAAATSPALAEPSQAAGHRVAEPLDEAGILGLAWAAERHSLHPIATALKDAARERLTPLALAAWDAQIQEVAEHPGAGLSGLWSAPTGSVRWRLGSSDFVGPGSGLDLISGDSGHQDLGPDLGETGAARPTAIWLSLDGKTVARLELEQALRPDAREALEALQAQGLALGIRSGDQAGPVAATARTLAISDWAACQSAQDKLNDLEQLQSRGLRVGMVGDGLNDGAALARAQVSISFAQATPLAQQQADILILRDRLLPIAQAHRQARRSLGVVRQNLIFAAVYNLTCIPLALLGWMPPWLAGLGMASSSLIVVLNALRLGSLPRDRATQSTDIRAT